MELAKAIEGWVHAHGDHVSASTRSDIDNIADGISERGYGSVDCSALDAATRTQLAEAVATIPGSLRSGAIAEFVSVVTSWAATYRPVTTPDDGARGAFAHLADQGVEADETAPGGIPASGDVIDGGWLDEPIDLTHDQPDEPSLIPDDEPELIVEDEPSFDAPSYDSLDDAPSLWSDGESDIDTDISEDTSLDGDLDEDSSLDGDLDERANQPHDETEDTANDVAASIVESSLDDAELHDLDAGGPERGDADEWSAYLTGTHDDQRLESLAPEEPDSGGADSALGEQAGLDADEHDTDLVDAGLVDADEFDLDLLDDAEEPGSEDVDFADIESIEYVADDTEPVETLENVAEDAEETDSDDAGAGAAHETETIEYIADDDWHLDDLDAAQAGVTDGDLDDADADADEGDDTPAEASSFLAAIGSSPPADLQASPDMIPDVAPPAADSGSGAFTAAAHESSSSKGTDWITVAYFAVAAICFALVIFFYVTR